MTAEAWTALASWVTALTTIVLVWGTLRAVRWQAEEQRALHAVDLGLRLSDRFNSPEMKWHRLQIATMLFNRTLPNAPNESSKRLLDFFDTIGVLVEKRMLSKEAAWSDFWWDAGHYHEALADRVAWIRVQHGNDPTIHRDFESLFSCLLDFESATRGIERDQARPTAAAVESFLRTEMAITAAPPAGVPPEAVAGT